MLQSVTVCCSALQCVAESRCVLSWLRSALTRSCREKPRKHTSRLFNTLQHTATRCNIHWIHCCTSAHIRTNTPDHAERSQESTHLDSTTHYNTLHNAATYIAIHGCTSAHVSTHTPDHVERSQESTYLDSATHCNTLQHTLQQIATRCNESIYTTIHGNTYDHAAQSQERANTLHGNTLQHTATHGNTRQYTATHGNTRQHTATHCSTLQHTQHTRSRGAKPRESKCSRFGRNLPATYYKCQKRLIAITIDVWKETYTHTYIDMYIYTCSHVYTEDCALSKLTTHPDTDNSPCTLRVIRCGKVVTIRTIASRGTRASSTRKLILRRNVSTCFHKCL